MHEDMRTLLNGYLDGELHGARLQEMQRHLTMCESLPKGTGGIASGFGSVAG